MVAHMRKAPVVGLENVAQGRKPDVDNADDRGGFSAADNLTHNKTETTKTDIYVTGEPDHVAPKEKEKKV